MSTITACIDSIVRGLRPFIRPGEVHELRILDCVDNPQYPPFTMFGYFDSDHLEDLAKAALAWTTKATGVYVTMNPLNPDLMARAANRVIRSRGTKSTSDGDIVARRRLTIDFDPERPAGISATDEEKVLASQLCWTVRQDLHSLRWPEPMEADSGNGYHLNYAVDLPADDGGLVERFLQSLSAKYSTPAVKVDASLFNASRIIKLYGTLSRKGDSIPTRPHRLAEVKSAPPVLWVVDRDLIEAFIQANPPPEPRLNPAKSKPVQATPVQSSGAWNGQTTGAYPEWDLSPVDDFNARADWMTDVGLGRHQWKIDNALSNGEIRYTRPGKNRGVSATTGHNKGFHVFTDSDDALPFKAGENYSKVETYALLEHGESDGGYTKTIPALIQLGFGSYVDNDGSIKQNPPPVDWKRTRPTPAGPALPEIEITTERHVVRDKAITALARDTRIFLRGNALATVARSPEATKKLFGGHILRNANGTHGVNMLDEPRLGCLLTENASLFTWGKDKHGEDVSRVCHPPAWLVSAVLSHDEYPGFRPLLTVAECPYVDLDGSIMSKPGYDETTGTVLIPPFVLEPIPEKPGQQDAIAAWGRLNWLVREFPWASGYDAAVWLTALLTAIQRPAIAGPVPGFAFNGNKAGCGKGLAIDAIGHIAWGGPVPCSQYPSDSVEAEKVVLSIAVDGIAAVHFDNIEEGNQYGNGAMDSALTLTVKGGRPLGQTRWVRGVPLRPCWFLSGNNISPARDAFRRWLICNLVTDLENPHERQCETDLKAYVAEHRPEIVRDALLILKAHHAAGSPSHGKPPLGSFEEWDRKIRAAVWFATGNDCLHTERQATAGSPDRVKKMALIEAWKNLPDQDKGITAAEAVKMAREKVTDAKDAPLVHPELNSALLELGWKGDLIDSNKLGYLIRGIENTNYGGSKFVRGENKTGNKVRWCVIGP